MLSNFLPGSKVAPSTEVHSVYELDKSVLNVKFNECTGL